MDNDLQQTRRAELRALSSDKFYTEKELFFQGLTDRGHADLKMALELGYSVGMDGYEIAQLIVEQGRDAGGIELLDIVGVIYQHVLNMAIASLEYYSGVDLCDFGVEVYCNSINTSIDLLSEGEGQKLKTIICGLGSDVAAEIYNDVYVVWLLNELDLHFEV